MTTLTGTSGDDNLAGGKGDTTPLNIFGEAGNDRLHSGPMNDTLNGGVGIDWAYFSLATGPVTVNLAAGSASGTGVGSDLLVSIENASGGTYDDTLIGDSGNNILDGSSGNDKLYGGLGSDVLVGGKGAGNDLLDGGEGFDYADYSSATAQVIVNLTTGSGTGGQVGTDTLVSIEGAYGGSGDDILTGDANSNHFTGGVGNDTIDGGGGADTAVYSGNRSNYTLTKTSTGWTVQSAVDGNDTLTSIERFKFADTAVVVDIAGTAGQAYRIYQAAFNRTPDSVGLGYWINYLDNGNSLNQAAAGFANSAEFKALYGANPTNAEVVARMYDNVLHRPGEAGGGNFWVNELNTKTRTVAEVLAGFSESAENQAALIGVIGGGFTYTPYI